MTQSCLSKRIIKCIGEMGEIELESNGMLRTNSRGLLKLLAERVNNYSYDQRYIIFQSSLSKHPKSVGAITEHLNISKEKFFIEQRIAFEKLIDFLSHTTL